MLPHMPDWKPYPTPNTRNGSWRRELWLSLWINVVCFWEHQVPLCLGNTLSTGICNGISHRNGCVTWPPWVRENYSNSTGIALLCWKPDLLKCSIPEMEHTPWKEGRTWGSWSGTSGPQPISSHLTVDDVAPPAIMDDMHNQVKFLKLPTSLSARPSGHILFSISASFDLHLCHPH